MIAQTMGEIQARSALEEARRGEVALAERVAELEGRLYEIKMQATRRHRASGLKRYLEVDLERIERLASES